jgi:hypothetical protein
MEHEDILESLKEANNGNYQIINRVLEDGGLKCKQLVDEAINSCTPMAIKTFR